MATEERRALDVGQAERMILERLQQGEPDEGELAPDAEAAGSDEQAVVELDEALDNDFDESPEAEFEDTETPATDEEFEEHGGTDRETVYEVTVDGQPQEVSLQDALNDYVGQRTIQQRLNDVALTRNEVNQQLMELTQERQQTAAMLLQLEELLSNNAGPEPDWVELARQLSPQEYQARKAEWERDNQDRMTLRNEAATRQQQVAETQNEYLQQHLYSEYQTLLNVWPEAETELASVIQEAQSVYGFTPQELVLTDHKQALALRDAVEYRKLKAQAPKAVKRARSAALKPSRSTPPKERVSAQEQEINKMRQKFRDGGGKSMNELSRILEKRIALEKQRGR